MNVDTTYVAGCSENPVTRKSSVRKTALQLTARFVWKFIVFLAVNVGRFMNRLTRILIASVGAALGGSAALIIGGTYHLVQKLRQQQAEPVSTYMIRGAKTGYNVFSVAGVVIGTLMGAVTIAGMLFSPAALESALIAMVLAPVVYSEYQTMRVSTVERKFYRGTFAINKAIKKLEATFINWIRR